MSSLFSRQRGRGRHLVFLHGFPMHQGIWDNFGERFIDEHTVITVDLPGFGKSPLPAGEFSLADVADQVIDFLVTHQITDSVLIGHSLGGYVALAMAEKRPDLFAGMILFHSTALADTPERKESRNKVIEFVHKNGAEPFTTNFIGPLFADPEHADIDRVRRIAGTTGAATVVAYAKAMRDRPERIKTLRSYKKPTLFLAGDKDPGISTESLFEQAKGCKNVEIHILQGVAHMGMFEKPGPAATEIKDFLRKI